MLWYDFMLGFIAGGCAVVLIVGAVLGYVFRE